jgi:hypothetical protein
MRSSLLPAVFLINTLTDAYLGVPRNSFFIDFGMCFPLIMHGKEIPKSMRQIG